MTQKINEVNTAYQKFLSDIKRSSINLHYENTEQQQHLELLDKSQKDYERLIDHIIPCKIQEELDYDLDPSENEEPSRQGHHQLQLQKFIIAEFDEQDLGPRNIFDLLEIMEGSKAYVCLDYLMDYFLNCVSVSSKDNKVNIFTVWLDLSDVKDEEYLSDYNNWAKLADLGVVVFDPSFGNRVRLANQILESIPI